MGWQPACSLPGGGTATWGNGSFASHYFGLSWKRRTKSLALGTGILSPPGLRTLFKRFHTNRRNRKPRSQVEWWQDNLMCWGSLRWFGIEISTFAAYRLEIVVFLFTFFPLFQ